MEKTFVRTVEPAVKASIQDLLKKGQRELRKKLISHVSIQETLDTLIRNVEEIEPDMLGSVLLLDGENRALIHCSAPSLPQEYCEAINGIKIGPAVGSCGTAAHTGECVIVEDIETHPYWEPFKAYALKHGLRACWSQPILSADDKILGTFALYYKQVRTPSQAEKELLEAAAELASIAIEWKQLEDELSQSTKSLAYQTDLIKTITNNATSALFMMDTKGHCTFMNTAAERMTGYTLDEIANKPLHNCIHHTHPDGTPYPLKECPIDRALPERNQVRAHEDIFVRKDGTFFPVLCAAEPIFENGEPVGTVVEVRDITREKEAQKALTQSHRETQLANLLLDSMSQVQQKFISGADQWTLWDEFVKDMLALTSSEYGYIGEVLYKENGDPYLVFRGLTNIAWNPETQKLFEGLRTRGLEFHNMDNLYGAGLVDNGSVVISNNPAQDPRKGGLPHGHPALNAFIGLPIYGRDGKLIGQIGLSNRPGGFDESIAEYLKPLLITCSYILEAYRNIESRKKAEQAIVESEERFRVMAEAAPVKIWMLNEAGKLTYCNQKTTDFFGYTLAELSDMGWADLTHPDDQEKLIEIIQTSFNSQQPYEAEIRYKRFDGEYRWLLLSAIPRFESDHFLGFVGSALDITERRQMREELERLVKERTAQLTAVNKELEAFAYSVSHDLRAPLRTIDGFSQAVREMYADKLDNRGQDYLTRIYKGTQQMGQLIDDMLNLSRLTRGELHVEKGLDLSRIAKEILEESQRHHPERTVAVEVEDNLIADADRNLAAVLLRNLLENAWKFTSKKSSAAIKVGSLMQDGKTVFYVQDNGAGFNMDYQDKLFGAFQRLHDTDEFPGTGVGLATVQRIVNRHGGKIWAEGRVDEGATFYFTLSA